MTVAWVVGRGGLLGSALERALGEAGTTLFVPRRRFCWEDLDRLLPALRDEVSRFADAIEGGEPWEIYWAAGIGTMGSAEREFVTETLALDALANALTGTLTGTLTAAPGRSTTAANGCFVLSSSAGAIYAGSRDPVITEASVEQPTTAYARAKLMHEACARRLADKSGVRLLVARISTLYGIGQATGKPQGLLTHMSRSLIRNKAIQIYVSLDTIRDYIAADDAAAVVVVTARSLGARQQMMRIVASEEPTTISEIVSIFKRISRRPPLIITSDAPVAGVYSRRIQFRSVVPTTAARRPTSLLVGISRVLAAERLRYVAAETGDPALR